MNIQTVTFEKTSFIVCVDPKDLELKYLKNNFGFSSLHLDDYVNKTQVPKIEVTQNYTLVVLDFPFFYPNGQNQKLEEGKNSIFGGLIPQLPEIPFPTFYSTDKKRRILASQVDFFIGRDFLVVLHDGMLSSINEFFAQAQKTLRRRKEFMEKGSTFLFYHIVDSLVDNCFPVINQISSSIEHIDRELETTQSEKILEDISTTRRNIVFFHTMIKPLLPLFRELEDGKYKQLNSSQMSLFWGNVRDHLQKIWDRLEDNKELIEGISESNESLLTSRTNRIVALLTIFSAILLPSTLLASIYGMNIEGLPFAAASHAFIIIIAAMFLIGTVMITIFKTRRWL